MGTGAKVDSEHLRAIFKSAPFVDRLGLEPVSAGQGECETRLAVRQDHFQQDGFVHAGVMATMADHTAGAAAATMVRAGELVLSAEFKINMLRPAQQPELRCRATVLKPGTRLTVVESEVYGVASGNSVLVAKAMVTLAVVPRPEST